MEINKIRKVKELSDYEAVNAYLELGWNIIGHYVTAEYLPETLSAHQTPHYCLCWEVEGKEPQYPPEKKNVNWLD